MLPGRQINYALSAAALEAVDPAIVTRHLQQLQNDLALP
jgi:hypothetical protein